MSNKNQVAQPDPAVIAAPLTPGLRLGHLLETFVDGYAERPAVGERARELRTDPATGRTTARLLAEFDTRTYRELWARVQAVAAAWSEDPDYRVAPGDFVATVGFSSVD